MYPFEVPELEEKQKGRVSRYGPGKPHDYILGWSEINDEWGRYLVPILDPKFVGKAPPSFIQEVLENSESSSLVFQANADKAAAIKRSMVGLSYILSLKNFLVSVGVPANMFETPELALIMKDWVNAKVSGVKKGYEDTTLFDSMMSKIQKNVYEDPILGGMLPGGKPFTEELKLGLASFIFGDIYTENLKTENLQKITADINLQVGRAKAIQTGVEAAQTEAAQKRNLYTDTFNKRLELENLARNTGKLSLIGPLLATPLSEDMDYLELVNLNTGIMMAKAQMSLSLSEIQQRDTAKSKYAEIINDISFNASKYGLPAPKIADMNLDTTDLLSINRYMSDLDLRAKQFQQQGILKEQREADERRLKAEAKQDWSEAGQLAQVSNQINLVGKEINTSLAALGLEPIPIAPTGDIFQQRQQLDNLQMKAREIADAQKAVEAGDIEAMIKAFNESTFDKGVKTNLYSRIVETQRQKQQGIKMATEIEEAKYDTAERQFVEQLIATGDVQAMTQGIPQIREGDLKKKLQDSLSRITAGIAGATKMSAQERQDPGVFNLYTQNIPEARNIGVGNQKKYLEGIVGKPYLGSPEIEAKHEQQMLAGEAAQQREATNKAAELAAKETEEWQRLVATAKPRRRVIL